MDAICEHVVGSPKHFSGKVPASVDKSCDLPGVSSHGKSHGSGGRINPPTPSLPSSKSLLLPFQFSSSLANPSSCIAQVFLGAGVLGGIVRQCHLV